MTITKPIETARANEEARACAQALERGFAAQNLADLYHDDLISWHNFTEKTATKIESLALVDGFFAGFAAKGFSRPCYVDIRRFFTDKGFVQQHVVEARRGGEVFRMPGCLIIEMRDGQIAKQDEYIDPTPYLKLMQQG